jgi:hypothetical protein
MNRKYLRIPKIMPEDLTFKERELREVELPSIKTSQLGAFVCGDISLAEACHGYDNRIW